MRIEADGPDRISILIPDGGQWIALHVARALRAAGGVSVHVMAIEKRAPIRHSRAVASFRVAIPRHDEERLAAIHDVAARTGAQVLLPVHEKAIRLASVHQQAIQTFIALAPVPPVESFDVLVDKRALSRFLAQHQIPQPRTIVFSEASAAAGEVEQLMMPALLKPAVGSGGRGIVRFDDRGQLPNTLAADPRRAAKSIVQEVVAGRDIDCSVLCLGGEVVAHTIQQCEIPARDPYTPPAGIAFVQHPRVLEITQQVMRALNWSGVAHLDFRIDERNGDAKLIEINPRFWATVMASAAAGVNVPQLAVLAALGRELPRVQQRPIRYVGAPAALGAIIRSRTRPRSERYTFRHSSLRHAIDDPLAEIARLARKILPGRNAP